MTKTNEQLAIELIHNLVRQWYAVDGTSASDLLDQICEQAYGPKGIVTPKELDAWIEEEKRA
jgi:hypothetical protein